MNCKLTLICALAIAFATQIADADGPRSEAPALDEAAIKDELVKWYSDYLDLYVRLGRGEQTDTHGLLRYLGIPFTVVTPDGVTETLTEAERISQMEASMKALREHHYSDAKISNMKITVLNSRAALIDGDWARYNDKGVAYDRFHSVYLVVRKAEGWRTTTIIRTPI